MHKWTKIMDPLRSIIRIHKHGANEMNPTSLFVLRHTHPGVGSLIILQREGSVTLRFFSSGRWGEISRRSRPIMFKRDWIKARDVLKANWASIFHCRRLKLSKCLRVSLKNLQGDILSDPSSSVLATGKDQTYWTVAKLRDRPRKFKTAFFTAGKRRALYR